MQVAGRALRYAPAKPRAHIVQVHSSPMEYHFEKRWLYQDISDQLRPDLLDRTYMTTDDLRISIQDLLQQHNVSGPVRERVLSEFRSQATGHRPTGAAAVRQAAGP